MAIYISRDLATDLNLPLEIPIPSRLHTIVLFLAVGRPPILCAVHKETSSPTLSENEEKKEKENKLEKEMEVKTEQESEDGNNGLEEVRLYLIHLAQKLKSALNQWCTTDFALLRFCLSEREMNLEGLKVAVDRELDFTARYFKGSPMLTEEGFSDVARGVDILVRSSFMPGVIREEWTRGQSEVGSYYS
jgi:hypothetical protein